MENNNEIINLIKGKKNVPKNKINLKKINGDGNCLFLSFSYYLNNIEENYNDIRLMIYNEAKTHKESILEFFI